MSTMRGVLVAPFLLGASQAPPTTPLPHPAKPGDGFEVSRYSVALTPNIPNKTIAGREMVTLRPTVDGIQRLIFSGNALVIDSATIDDMPVVHDLRGDALGFDLPRPLRRGRSVTLRLSYHGRPARGFAGSAATLYTSYFACDWMICSQNTFGEKAAFTLDLTVPAGMTSLSVGAMVAKRRGPDGTEVHRWRVARPYSAYLYGFAVGPFTKISEPFGPNRLTYLSDVATGEELKRRFAETPDMVAFLADKAGVPLPVATYSQLLVEGDEAQEAATYSVLGTNALPTKPDDPADEWAIMHELTHQWWGNLITCEALKDFWLNEGITTFMTAAWKEHRYGRAAYDAELDVAKRRVERARAAGFDKPLAWDGTYPSLTVWRAIHYSKGALFMAHLRTLLGDDAFWGGLRRYTRDHAGGTVTSIDLERAMEASSGRDLRSLFLEWVFGGGAPHSVAG
ncbi:M1 family aminopeptidase [Sphingomonas sanguinis]|uniref:M1 family metallopeptidase n=1 Tax=Sphingomonas sp. LC-1 TaxID=3110957 RepID=UPI0021BB7C26|nr:M1 family aminopeptidase [Sphingomonas sp. LC-1]MCT8002815.1 M1 family aminopeptidase [Sphingomonas sp. LC-1]